MGLLDELRKQSQDKQAKDEDEAAREAAREQYYTDEMLPRLREAYRYLAELTQHLNYLQTQIVAEYALLPDGAPVCLRQNNYRVLVDSNEQMRQVDLKIDAELDKPVEFEIHGKEAVLRHADRLDRYFIRYQRQDGKDERFEVITAKFILEGPLPLGLTIYADVEQGRFRLSARNFYDPGRTVFNLSTEQLNTEMLDRIGRYLVRETAKLMELDISEDARETIRQKLETEREQRERELKEAELAAQQAEEEERKRRDLRYNLSQGGEKLLNQVNENKKKIGDLLHRIKSNKPIDKS